MKRLRAFWGVALCCFGLSMVAAAQGGNDSGGPGPPVPVGQTSTTRLAALIFTTATVAGTPFTINQQSVKPHPSKPIQADGR